MDSDLLDFKLYAGDSSFVRLTRGSYIKLDSTTYSPWFTGFVTNEPALEYFGTDHSHNPIWGFSYQATADDYLLNLQPLGFLPNYMNTHMGDIIKSLVNILAPGVFDVTNVGNGQFTAQYAVTPQTYFRDIIKDFCEACSYVFYARDKKLYFVQQDSLSSPLTLDGNDKHFTPTKLSIKPSNTPLINQAYVLGELEPQTYVNSYFVGDSFTAQFPLISDVFGVDRFILIDESFSGSSVNNNVWVLNDPAGNKLTLFNGYLNCTGGSGGSAYDTNLQSLYPVPLEGDLRFTHGEWDFLEAAATSVQFGVIGGLWTTPSPTSSLAGCVYGLMDEYNGVGAHILSPVVNGVKDVTQSVSVDNTKRYVIRTLASFGRLHRVANVYSYTTASGAIATIGLLSGPDTVSWHTTVTEIDPTTGLVSFTTTLRSDDVAINSSTLYATYIPIASSGVHCTVTGITVSVPLQASLEHETSGTSGYTLQLIGPNEIDSLDNTAPVATITQANINTNTRSSYSGKPLYNAGQALLQYFKDSTTLSATTPPVGTIIHLKYRAAGYALGKSQNNNSVLAESSVWGDSGIRSLVNTSMSPRPRTSQECELAAAAIVSDNVYQHYEGTYEVYSEYVTHEPIAGSFLKFTNLPSYIPQVQAEEINQVKTTFVCSKPSEKFTHQITFGKPDYLRKLVHDFYQPKGIFEPTDANSTPYGIDTTTVGTAFIDDVYAPTLDSWDDTNLNYDLGQDSPAGGGFEIRYTDDSWGVDDGKNLVTRVIGTRTFSVPRTARSKVIFIKAYDARNKLWYSEDFTQSTWSKTSATATASLGQNSAGGLSKISAVAFSASGQVYQAFGAGLLTGTFSLSIKGTAGNSVTVKVMNGVTVVNQKTVVLSGLWQRVSVYGASATVCVVTSAVSQTVKMTFASFEVGVQAETIYCKTNAGSYGALSRFASAIHVAFPLRPNPPTGTVDTSDPANVVIGMNPPVLGEDCWGLELRAADNTTVLFHEDLVAAAAPYSYTDKAATSTPTYFLYAYNLLGEYSVAGNLEAEIGLPKDMPICPVANAYLAANPLYGTINGLSKVAMYSLYQAYTDIDKNGNSIPKLTIGTHLPVTTYISHEAAPILSSLVYSVDMVNGTLPGGHTYYVAFCGVDASSNATPVSKMLAIDIPAGSHYKITIPVITIPNPSQMTLGVLFLGVDTPQTMQKCGTVTLPTAGVGLTTSVTGAVIIGLPASNSPAPPNIFLDKMRLKAKPILHSGVAGAAITDISSYTIVCDSLIDTSVTPDDWTGRIVSVVTRSIPRNGRAFSGTDFKVTGWDASTGTFTLDPAGRDPLSVGPGVGDILVIRASATTVSSTTIGDATFSNITNSHTGLVVSGEQNYFIRIIAGKGVGQVRKIVDNTIDTYTVDTAFAVIPDATSAFIVEAPQWTYEADSQAALANTSMLAGATVDLGIDNWNGAMFLTMLFSVTKDGVESLELYSPFSEIWVFGIINTVSNMIVASY